MQKSKPALQPVVLHNERINILNSSSRRNKHTQVKEKRGYILTKEI